MTSLVTSAVAADDDVRAGIQAQGGDGPENIVFSNNKLREKILGKVIYSRSSSSTTKKRTSGDHEINYVDLPNLRLVQKSWLFTVSQILHQKRHPVLHLHSLETIPLFLANRKAHQKLLKNYTQTQTTMSLPLATNLAPVLPTLKISLICAVFIPENFELLNHLFKKCRRQLVSLHIIIPKYCTMPGYYPSISLPILQELVVELADHRHSDIRHRNSYFIQENFLFVIYLQQVMDSCKELKTIKFIAIPRSLDTALNLIPAEFGSLLSLPNTVETLIFEGLFPPIDIEFIVESMRGIAHLKTLSIATFNPILVTEELKIGLEQNADTLEKLKLGRMGKMRHILLTPSTLNLPPLRQLKELSLCSDFQLVNDFTMKSADFPKLTKFRMNGISDDLYDKLTAKGEERRVRLLSVKKLQIKLINNRDGSTVSLNEDRMQRAYSTFWNVTELKVTICGRDVSGMKYILKEMGRQLTSLGITVMESGDDGDDVNSDLFDGLFGGIRVPEAIAQAVDQLPQLWPYFMGLTSYGFNPSLRKLGGLTKLKLATKNMKVEYMPGEEGGELRNCLISEESFEYAFLRMPKLRSLKLFGRFQPNLKMVKMWKDEKENRGLGEPLVYGHEDA